MALDITGLQVSVAKCTTVEQSAITLLNGLSAQIKTLASQVIDPATQAALTAMGQQLDAGTQGLADAVTANTPAAPPAPAP